MCSLLGRVRCWGRVRLELRGLSHGRGGQEHIRTHDAMGKFHPRIKFRLSVRDNMKAFKVFWNDNISSEPSKYVGSAVVIAKDVQEALTISSSYGEVKSIHGEDDVVITGSKLRILPVEKPVPTPVPLNYISPSDTEVDAELFREDTPF